MGKCYDMIKNWISKPNVQSEYGEPVYTTISEVKQLLDKWEIGYSNIDFYSLEAYHRVENVKSARVLQKSAMQITDTVQRFSRANILPEGEVCGGVYEYSK